MFSALICIDELSVLRGNEVMNGRVTLLFVKYDRTTAQRGVARLFWLVMELNLVGQTNVGHAFFVVSSDINDHLQLSTSNTLTKRLRKALVESRSTCQSRQQYPCFKLEAFPDATRGSRASPNTRV